MRKGKDAAQSGGTVLTIYGICIEELDAVYLVIDKHAFLRHNYAYYRWGQMAAKRTSEPPKIRALLEEGTLNLTPEQVRDPKFQQNEFFDPRDLVQVKYEMLRR